MTSPSTASVKLSAAAAQSPNPTFDTAPSRTHAEAFLAVELMCHGLEHSPVNAGLLETLRFAFPDRPIVFYAEAEHLSAVRSLVRPAARDTIEWSSIEIPARQARRGARFGVEFRVLYRLFEQARETPALVLLLSALESTLFAVRMLHALPGRNIPVQAVLHGNLTDVVGWRSRNPFMRALDLRSALSFAKNRLLRYIVLEPAIARRLVQLLPDLGSAVDWLRHPVPPGEGDINEPIPPLPVNVSFFGLASAHRGFDVFLRTAREVLHRRCGHVEFHAVGWLPPGAPVEDLTVLSTVPQADGLIPRERYVAALRAAHYICLPYQGSHYDLSASGVLLDAIAWGKPVIAMPSPTLRDMIAAQPEMGYLCSTPQEMTDVIATVAGAFDEKTYRRRVAAIAKLREERLPERLGVQYGEVTRRFLQSCA